MPQNPNTPNHQPAAPAELSAEERAVFSIEKVDAWRARQVSILVGLRESARGISDTQYIDDFHSTVDSTLEDFLQEQGIDQTSPNYAEIKQLFYDARIGNDNDGGTSSNVWENSPKARGVDPNDTKSQREVFAERIADRVGVDQDDPVDYERSPEKIEAIDELEAELEDLRNQMAKATAKRQDKFFGAGGKKYAELKKEYYAMVQELGRRHLDLHYGMQDVSDDETKMTKNVLAMTVIVDEQEKLREKTIEELEGKPLGKFINWMNKGNVATRIAKGIGLGLGAGLVGSLIASGVGAGIAAGGTVIASRFARNFAIKDNKTRGMASIYSEDDKSSSIDFDASVLNTDTSVNFTGESNRFERERMEKITELTGANEAFEADTKNEQSKRVKSALFGTAMIGVGAFAGYGIHQAMEWRAGKDLTLTGYVANKWDEFWNGPDTEPPDEVTPPGDGKKDLWGPDGDRDQDGDLNADDSDKDGDGVLNEDDFAPLNPDVSVDPNAPDWSEVPHDARWVEPGEGWYQTFQELGIPQEHWADTLETAGPELEEQGWAYFDEANNEWRISQPGRLPDGSLDVIADAAKRDGFTLAA